MDRGERLRQAAKRLRGEAREAKTPSSRDVRAEAAELAEKMAHDHDMVAARWEALEDPAVLEHGRRRVGNALADQEIRAAIRKEQAEPTAPLNPAQMALSRSDDERLREKAWGDDTPREGWLT